MGPCRKASRKLFRRSSMSDQNFFSYGGRVGMTVAVWRNGKFIVFSLPNKGTSTCQPLSTLQRRVKSLRQFLLINNISEFACPEISAGLDRVPLETVINIIRTYFNTTTLPSICIICNLTRPPPPSLLGSISF